MSTDEVIRAIANELCIAESHRTPTGPIREQFPGGDSGMSAVEFAYAIQQLNVSRRIEAGERLVGRKIGLTSLAVQQQLGVDQPDFGALFASMTHGDDQPIALSELIQPKVEAEIALVLAHDLTRERHTFDDIVAASACAVAAVEVVDSRIRNWDIRFIDTVADNASSARFVIGSRQVPLSQIDLTACAMTLSRDGDVLSRGSGSACLGNPLNAAVWLADRMVELGTPLRAGDVVLTGALGPMVAVTEPGTYLAQIDGLGSVRATFSA
ncbi:2-keto-4-pentenoate hydratase [Burkholderia paludis]|uniref:fumarylacetoacetate hydrolase family protein n=1 Tax=Burkholderia paludis TaxID=1506587 RepID=UPI0004DB8640|nr:fumarylacetoacetate hydrolase family protein [Burkholderia paludis]KFG95347.1 2-keto-4-pentenoate hydratase [Burkholderia paludis]